MNKESVDIINREEHLGLPTKKYLDEKGMVVGMEIRKPDGVVVVIGEKTNNIKDE